MIAEIIAAGSEMLTPFRQDTNSLYLTDGLNDLGDISPHYLKEIEPDVPEQAPLNTDRLIS